MEKLKKLKRDFKKLTNQIYETFEKTDKIDEPEINLLRVASYYAWAMIDSILEQFEEL